MAVISGDGIFTRAMLRANDLDASARFYDAALSPLGWKILGPFDDERMPWDRNKPAFPVVRPGTGEASSSGVTIGFAAEATRGVDAFHAAGLAAGGTDEGAPAPRRHLPGGHAAYFRDPGGNKVCAYALGDGN